jgi:hypothetical protein
LKEEKYKCSRGEGAIGMEKRTLTNDNSKKISLTKVNDKSRAPKHHKKRLLKSEIYQNLKTKPGRSKVHLHQWKLDDKSKNNEQ